MTAIFLLGFLLFVLFFTIFANDFLFRQRATVGDNCFFRHDGHDLRGVILERTGNYVVVFSNGEMFHKHISQIYK